MIIYVSLEEELKRETDLKESDIEHLRQWCAKQPHLPKISDSELIMFLHSNYYRIEPTKTTIDNYYTYRTHVPEFFGNRDPLTSPEIQSAMKIGFCMPLKTKTNEGYQVIAIKLLDGNPSAYSYNNTMKYYNMVMDLWMFSEGTMNGHVIVVDIEKVVLGHVAKLSPMGFKKYLFYLQEALPVRLKGLHITNTVPAMDIIFSMMKPFMKKELLDMFHMHKNVKSLAKFVPIEALPNEMGGKAGPIMQLHEAEIKLVEENADWFAMDEQEKRVNESKRPGKGKSAEDLFGVEGVFKKLEID